MAAMERSRQRSLFARLALVLLAVLFVAGVALSDRLLRHARLDLTEEGAYTLAEDSRRVVSEIDEPIVLRFYFSSRISREIPQVGVYARHVRDLLEEFAAVSDGRIELQVFDPEPFTDAEDRADSFGLQGLPVDRTGERVFFGLAGTNSIDDVELIPFFDETRERDLEYDIARIVHSLANPERPAVGLITGLPIAGSPMSQSGRGQNDAWAIYNLLLASVDVRQIISTATSVPEGVGVVVLVHPKRLTDETLYALDQFVLRGGKLLVFVDPHSEGEAQHPDIRRRGMPPEGFASNLERLFEAWGIELAPGELAGDSGFGRRVQVPDRSRTRLMAVDYPLWLGIDRKGISRADSVSAELSLLNIASPGHFRTTGEVAGVEVTPLVTTSDDGGTVPVSLVQGPIDPLAIVHAFEPAEKPLVLAARLTGEAATAFPDGPPEPEAPEEDDRAADSAKDGGDKEEDEEERAAWEALKAAHLERSSAPMDVIAVADVDMLADPMWMVEGAMGDGRIGQVLSDNAAFFLNAVENMTGRDDLVSLRSRGSFQRPFTLVEDIRREAESKHRAKEKELLDRLEEALRRLNELERDPSAEQQVVLTTAQTGSLKTLRADVVRLRRELRDVQHRLRQDVEALTSQLEVVNIALVPALVALFAIVLAYARRARRRRAQEGGRGA
ncbi:MAG: ABC transporter [Alphaproteobacteria bacterium]|nr:ABC transporter [Alphaproteobacteria bacterium]